MGSILPTEGHERLPLMNKTDRFRVRGIIERAGIIDVSLKDASIELLQDQPQ